MGTESAAISRIDCDLRGFERVGGAAVAAVTAAISVRFLVGWLTRHGLAMFAYYRLATALLLSVLLAGGFLQG